MTGYMDSLRSSYSRAQPMRRGGMSGYNRGRIRSFQRGKRAS